jgi:hypothetical protein
VASDRRRGGIDGFQQFRRSFQRGERLPSRISWAEQLSGCAANRATASTAVTSPQSDAPKVEPAAGTSEYRDFAWETAGDDECDVVEEFDLLVANE